MAQLFIVPEKDYTILQKYSVTEMGESIVLVPEPVIDGPDFPKEMAEKLRALDGMAVDYDFGGEPDVYVDVVTDKRHYALATLASDQTYEQDGEV